MNNQLKTALMMFGSTILCALVLDVMLQNIFVSSGISFLICVCYFYDPKKVEARYNKAKAAEKGLNPEINASSTEPKNNKKSKKNKKNTGRA